MSIDTFYERLHPDDRERARLAMAESIANHVPYDIEYRTVSPDGRKNGFGPWAVLRMTVRASPTSFDGLTLDITERKRAEEAIRESEERLRLAQKTAHSGTWDKSFVDGQINRVAGTGRTMGPCSRVRSWVDDDAALRSAINSEDLAEVDRLLSRALETKEPEYRAEFRITRPDGVLRWIETIARIFYDSGGKALRIIGISIDVTERKQIRERERLMAAEAVAATAKFRAVFEQTPVFAGNRKCRRYRDGCQSIVPGGMRLQGRRSSRASLLADPVVAILQGSANQGAIRRQTILSRCAIS